MPTNSPLFAVINTAKTLDVQELIVGVSNKNTADEQLDQIALYWFNVCDGQPKPLTARIVSRDREVHLDLAGGKINAPAIPAGAPGQSASLSGAGGDEAAMYRMELKTLSAALVAAAPRASDRATKAHIEAARDQITRMLDPKVQTPNPPAAATRIPPSNGLDSCWPDYIILP